LQHSGSGGAKGFCRYKNADHQGHYNNPKPTIGGRIMKARNFFGLLFSLAVLVLAGCGGGGGGGGVVAPLPVAPTITVAVSKTTAANTGLDSVSISATVLVSGAAASGKTVSFAIKSGSGALSAASAVTAANGVASVGLTSTADNDTNVITATVEGVSADSASVTFTNPNTPINPNDPGSIALVSSGPGTTLAGGAVTLTATVTPKGAGTIANGTAVTFSIVSGNGTLSNVTTTAAGGIATATLSASTANTISVKASIGSVASSSVSVLFTDPNNPGAILLTANPASGAGLSVQLTATVTPLPAGTVANGTVVTFAVTSGSGTLSNITTTTNGVATATLSATSTNVTIVTASAGGVTSSPRSVSFTNFNDPGAVALSATPGAGTILAGGSVTLRATVTPLPTGTIANGSTVTFAIASGSGTLSNVTTTTNGVATATLSAATPNTVTVTATAGGITSAQLPVVFTNPNAPLAITLTSNPGSGTTLANGFVTLSAAVTPFSGSGTIANATPVNFAITSGTGTLSNITTTNNGVATATLSAANPTTVRVVASVAATAVSPAVSSNNLDVGFVNQPTLAIFKLGTTGPALASGVTIGGIQVVVGYSGPYTLGNADVAPTGVTLQAAPGSFLFVPNVSSGSLNLGVASISSSGIGLQSGEFATLSFHVAPGTFTAPTLSLSSISVLDTNNQPIPGMSVAVLSTTLQ
jgi:hypothetical protein